MEIKAEAKANLLHKMATLLSEYHHRNTMEGLNEILRVWNANKFPLMELFSRHPNWDADNFRIVFSQDYNRPFEEEAIEDFIEWVKGTYKKEVFVEDTIDGISFQEFDRKADILSYIVDHLDSINNIIDEDVVLNGVPFSEWIERRCTTRNKIMEFRYSHSYINRLGVWMKDSEKNGSGYTPDKLSQFLRVFSHVRSNIVDEELAGKINEIFPDLRVGNGTRIMKVVRKVCVAYGLDKVVQMQTNEWDTTDPNTGEVIHHSREVNMGYNGQIARLGDRINPFKIKRHTIVSFNPLDFLTMSFGHNWASCQTIDKENLRGVEDHNYEGMYCSGTLSYMLDKVSFIFATFDAAYMGNEFETQDKLQRCMFHLNEDFDLLLQGRAYPDARDGGDESLAGQFRQIVQKVITDCTGENNLWTVKGVCGNSRYWDSYGTHYRDYEKYSDCTISFLKNGKESDDYKTLQVGHNPICPVCGEEHTTAGYLCCDEHNGAIRCECCGDVIDVDDSDTIHCEDNDCYYCSERCAERDGLHYCEDDEEWHTEENCYRDDYYGAWYSGDPEVTTEDGNTYGSEDTARADGYEDDSDGYWWPEEEVYYDSNRCVYFHCDDMDELIEINGNYYVNEASAEEAGYIKYDDDWYSESEMVEDGLTAEMFPQDLDGAIEVDGAWYMSEENAIADGCSRTEDGEWAREYEEVAA